MNWLLYRWTWLVESPLFVGATPAGNLARCRLYIPARTLWGALTAEVARQQTPGMPDYITIGEHLKKLTRFTYLFPAEEVHGKWQAWLPGYEQGKGLVWRLEDGKKSLSEREFRQRLLWTRPSTAIDPQTDTASEGKLHETECMNTFWQGKNGTVGSQVAMVGYLFLRNESIQKPEQKNAPERGSRNTRNHSSSDGHDNFNPKGALGQVAEIAVGGDTRYGLGRLRRVEQKESTTVFGLKACLQEAEPLVESSTVLAHAITKDNNGKNGDKNEENKYSMSGDLEVLAGWDLASGDGLTKVGPGVLWCPGSRISTQEPSKSQVPWRLMPSGVWKASPTPNP